VLVLRCWKRAGVAAGQGMCQVRWAQQMYEGMVRVSGSSQAAWEMVASHVAGGLFLFGWRVFWVWSVLFLNVKLGGWRRGGFAPCAVVIVYWLLVDGCQFGWWRVVFLSLRWSSGRACTGVHFIAVRMVFCQGVARVACLLFLGVWLWRVCCWW
jgi:hypothetical protein